MTRLAFYCGIVFVFCLTAFGQTQTKKFYEYEIIESTRPGLEVFAAPSINDYGDVAFSARLTPGGGTVFLNVLGQPNVDLLPNAASNQFVGGRVQINNSRQIIQQTFISGTKPAQTLIRRINGSVGDYTIVAYANGAGSFNDFDQLYDGAIGINNDGEPVYTGVVNNTGTNLITGVRPNFSILNFPSSGDSLRPSISDCGYVVARAGANTTDPIRLYDPDLASFEDIATTADGFTALGRSPAVSDLCDVVTFYGELNAAGAEALGTNPGPGIFASIEIDAETGMRRIVRLAGRLIENNAAEGGNDDGYCDPGETCMQGELGFTSGGSPIFFSSFDDSTRVAVTHQSVGEPGIEDDIFVTSFIGTPNIGSELPDRPFTNQRGLWTLTAQIKNIDGNLVERPAVAVPVVQHGDVVEGRTVTAVNVYDQIAAVRLPNAADESPGDHRLTFHLATIGGNLIVRAERKVETPVIFIPGILGSTLKEDDNGQLTERWIGLGNGALTGGNLDRLIPVQSSVPKIVATDAIKTALTRQFYGPLIDESLAGQGGLRLYDVAEKEERRTEDGCDMNQRFVSPTLFVFAYDWRKSNVENSFKLRDYIGCIRRFYPGTKVNIVAHSMGGLLARHYIVRNLGSHHVDKLITIGSPFLGAPKALEVIETGRLRFAPEWLDKRLPRFITNRTKQLAQNSPGVHELFPSLAYFALGGRPFREKRYDINGDGLVPQIYEYPDLFGFYNARFLGTYSTNQAFHSFSGQDDWRFDASGVEYFHIIGGQSVATTIETIIASPTTRLPMNGARRALALNVEFGDGDETVPNLSATKIGLGIDLNANNATLIRFQPSNSSEDKLYEHTGLVKAPDVRNEILHLLELPHQSTVGSSTQQNLEDTMKVVVREPGGKLNLFTPNLREAYYAKVIGVDRLEIIDNQGNTNTPVGDIGYELAVPGVRYSGGLYDDQNDIGYHHLSMPAEEGAYTIKFRTVDDSIDIEVLKGVGNTSPNLAIRYIDLELPSNVDCLLTFDPQGVPDLRYDSNGDGTYDVAVPAHVRVSGAAAQDVTAPAVSFSKDMSSGLVAVNAADSESGVKTIYYRYAGDTSFRIYTEPFVPESDWLEAFADDNVGNRSSPVTASLVSISGRVKDTFGRGISLATVTLTDSQGMSRIWRTNTLGYYLFDKVLTGQSYEVNVSSRRYSFEPRSINLTGEVTGFDFVANP